MTKIKLTDLIHKDFKVVAKYCPECLGAGSKLGPNILQVNGICYTCNGTGTLVEFNNTSGKISTMRKLPKSKVIKNEQGR